MTHIDEAAFQDSVEQWLRRWYVDVTPEPVLDSRRRPDFIAGGPFHTLVVEVENDFEAAFKGVGQVLAYASELRSVGSEEHDVVPVLVLPRGHVEAPEVEYLREHVRVVTVPHPDP